MISKHRIIMVRPRIYIGEKIAIGPGKIDLLRKIAATQSLAAAARELKIPYKRAWLLIDSLNQGFGKPVVETITGGKGGGQTTLTDLGKALIERYLALESRLNHTSYAEFNALCQLAD
jgi:molybdate transport system regulatory protein